MEMSVKRRSERKVNRPTQWDREEATVPSPFVHSVRHSKLRSSWSLVTTKRHFLRFHRNYSAKLRRRRKHLRYECHLGNGGGGGGYINPSKCTRGGARRDRGDPGHRERGRYREREGDREACATERERRMVSEEEVKVNEGETDAPIHSAFMDDRQRRGYKMPAPPRRFRGILPPLFFVRHWESLIRPSTDGVFTLI